MIFVGKTIPWFHRWRNVWKMMFPIGLATHLGSKLIPLLSFLGRVSTCSWSLRKNNILKWCPVSWNGGTSKSSILIGFFSKNHLFWGTPQFMEFWMNLWISVPKCRESYSFCRMTHQIPKFTFPINLGPWDNLNFGGCVETIDFTSNWFAVERTARYCPEICHGLLWKPWRAFQVLVICHSKLSPEGTVLFLATSEEIEKHKYDKV